MKRTSAAFLCLALAFLFACGRQNAPAQSTQGSSPVSEKDKTTSLASTEEPSASAPNHPKAVMPPLQGGPMLYSFEASEPYKVEEVKDEDGSYTLILYYEGLVNQNGDVVVPPKYERTDYVYADDSKTCVIGLIARRDKSFTYYTLDGKSKKLACEGLSIEVFQGGKYAVVGLAEDGRAQDYHDGLFDLEKNVYVVEPRAGQMIQSQYKDSGMVFGYDYGANGESEKTVAQWFFVCATEVKKEVPMTFGRLNNYHMRDKVFETVENFVWFYYDQQWERVAKPKEPPEPQTDQSQYKLGNGEQFRTFSAFMRISRLGYNDSSDNLGTLVLDKNLTPKMLFDAKGILVTGSETPLIGDFYANEDQIDYYCKYVNGTWTVLKSSKFWNPDSLHEISEGPRFRAAVFAACEDYLVLNGWNGKSGDAHTFAINWEGNPYNNCPLEKFFDKEGMNLRLTAGEQGPEYYWIDDSQGKRGYVDVRGNWLFVAPANT